MKPTYVERLIDFLTEAVKQNYSPARAVYAQVVRAHGLYPEFSEDVLDRWMLQAISEGYLFPETSSNSSTEKIISAQKRFRDAGGYCCDPFLKKADIKNNLTDKLTTSEPIRSIDHVGNTNLHVAAAFGAIGDVKFLIESHKIPVDIENDNAETALYKACQAGHAEVVNYLLENGAKASIRTKNECLTPLHWLFVFPQELINDVAKQLIDLGGADVNAVMQPSSSEAANGFPRKVPINHLYVSLFGYFHGH